MASVVPDKGVLVLSLWKKRRGFVGTSDENLNFYQKVCRIFFLYELHARRLFIFYY